MTKKEALKRIQREVTEVASEFGLTLRYHSNTGGVFFPVGCRVAVFTLGECDLDHRGYKPNGRFGVGDEDMFVEINEMGHVNSCEKLCVNGFHSKFQYAISDRMRTLDILVQNNWVITGGKAYSRGKEVKL